MAILLSFLGIGRKNENPDASDVYKRMHHVFFQEESTCETALSVYALMQKHREKISQVYIIGTHTSSWSALLEEVRQDCSDLFIQVEQEIDKQYVKDESLQAIEKILSQDWEVKVSCVSHTKQIDSCTMEELHQLYQKIVFTFPQNTEEIIFDVTHGFRSMPLLMMTALEFREIMFPACARLHVLYVELQGEKALVREITPIYAQTEKNHAVRLFLDSFEGKKLADHVNIFWPKGAHIISRFSSIIHGNSVKDLFYFINNQLADALNSADYNSFPYWFCPVYEWMQTLYTKLHNERRSALIASVADLLLEKHMYGQAFMALHASFQVYIHEYYQEIDSIGDWEHFKVLRSRFYYEGKAATYQEKKTLKKMEGIRNTIAHGGSINEGKPFHVENLPYAYASCSKAVNKLINSTDFFNQR